MTDTQANNRRIARNTLMLYLRMLFVMAISLYLSRIVLNALGVSDYGIYNVVGGVVSFLGVFNSSMGAATQRFLTFDLGRNDINSLKRCFGACVNLYIILSVIVILLAETIGLWFVNTKLNIPSDRMVAANFVYQFTILTSVASLLQNPFSALITAHERMDAFAWISICDILARLVLSIIVLYAPNDHLILYSGLIAIEFVVVSFIYYAFCRKKFIECKFRLFFDKKLYAKIVSYSGWNLFGTSAGIISGQGVNIMLNMFFGPAVNAARGIAMQISGAVSQFFGNFYTAVRPQIVKYYADNNLKQMHSLIINSARFAYYLGLMVMIPVFVELPRIIEIWLGQTPNHLIIFSRLTLVCCLFDCLSNPLMSAALASDKIRNYQIVVATSTFLAFPLSYIAIKLTSSPTAPFVISIFISVLSMLLRAYFVEKLIGLKVITFTKSVIIKVIPATIISPVLPTAMAILIPSSISRLAAITVSSILFSAIVIFTIGLNREERTLVINKFKHYAKAQTT